MYRDSSSPALVMQHCHPSPDSECHWMGGADAGTVITAQPHVRLGTGQMLPSVELQLCGGIFQVLCALQ